MPPPMTLPQTSNRSVPVSSRGPDPPRSSTTTSTTHDSIVPEFNSTPVPQRDQQVQRDYDQHRHHHHHRDQFTPLPQMNQRSNSDQFTAQRRAHHHQAELHHNPPLPHSGTDPGGGQSVNRANSPDFFRDNSYYSSRDQQRQERLQHAGYGVRQRASPRYQPTPPPPQAPPPPPTQQNRQNQTSNRTLEQVFHQHHHQQSHHQNYNQLQSHENQVIFRSYGVNCSVLLFAYYIWRFFVLFELLACDPKVYARIRANSAFRCFPSRFNFISLEFGTFSAVWRGPLWQLANGRRDWALWWGWAEQSACRSKRANHGATLSATATTTSE